jgi:peptidyl-prolyl cis-trans isomerase SurA
MIKILTISFSILLICLKSIALENKILFKIDSEIITTADMNNEANYLKILNKNMNSLEQNQIFEITKNSLIRDKIKKNEILKFIKEIKIDNEIMEKLIKSSYQKSGFSSKAQFIQKLKEKNLRYSYVENKLSINALWNQLIYEKFSSKIKIRNKEIRDNIIKEGSFVKKFLLSEIVFDLDQNSNLDKKYNQIKDSIKKNGFENTALRFSISESANNGGKLDWISEVSLNKKFLNEINNLEIGYHTNPMVIPGGFILIKLNDVKKDKKKIDLEEEFKKVVKIKTNQQLNTLSNIYLKKILKNYKIENL